jgi:hypothetical protein
MGRSGVYPLFFAIAIVCYVSAVIIAFPLGALLEVVNEEVCLYPLAIGAFAMSIGMLLETRTH